MSEEVILKENDKPNKANITQIIFLIILVIAIGSLVYASVTIVKYHEMISNPLGYNLEKFGMDSCTCFKSTGEQVLIKSTLSPGGN